MNYKYIRNIFSKIIQTNLKEEHSFSRNFVIFGYRILYSLIFTIEKKILLFKNRSKYGKLYFNRNYYVNPKKIQYGSLITDNSWYYYSRILDGDWDQSKILNEDSAIFQAIRHRFIEGKNWEDTEYYQLLTNKENNKILSGGYSKEFCDKKFRKLDMLYNEIKNNGYKSKKELDSSKRRSTKFDIQTILDDVSVDIGREGRLLSVHGKHRLSIATLLDIPLIPIVINKRHKEWMEFRTNIKFYFRNHQHKNQLKVLTHPDLRNISFKKGKIPFKVIKENVSFSKGTLLDIGANLGFFCLKFEDEGFLCYAMEENQILLQLLKKLKSVENRKFKIIPGSIFNFEKYQEITFDVILALNIFHKFLKKEDTYFRFITFLKKLKGKELIFEVYNPRDFRNKVFYRNYKPDEFVNFIIENSCMNKARFICKTKNGRSLYKLTSTNSSL